MEFAYDVVNTVQDEPEGQRAARPRPADRRAAREPGRLRVTCASPRRANCDPGRRSRRRDLPARRPPGRRHEPQLSVRLGLEHRRHLRPARLRPGLRARGQEHDGHRAATRSSRWSRAHELARALLPGPGDLRRPHARPDRQQRPRAGDGRGDQQRLHERARLGARLRDQRRDDRLVLLRHARLRLHAGARRPRSPAARRRSRTT